EQRKVDVETISTFRCSNEMVNRLHDLMKRTLLNNFQGKPTDTPVFEKNGWLGDLNVALKSILYNFDVNEFLSNFTFMMADCMHDCDNITIMIPSVIWKRRNSPVWNTVFVFTIEALYDYYGNTDIVNRLYPEVRRMAQKDIAFVESRGWVWDVFELADWVAPMNDEFCAPNAGMSEGIEICGTVYVHAMLHSAARLARLMGQEEDAQEYEAAAAKIRTAFNARYYRPETREYVTEFWEEIGIRSHYRQTSNLLALAFGMAPEGEEERIFARLVESFESRDYHLDTGCVGTPLVLPVLFDYGRADIAWKVLTQTTYPSWGYWIANGSTTAWEHWEVRSRSLDHYFLGTYEEALYSHILGIRNVRDGFKRFIVAPEIGCGLDFAEGSVKTPQGMVSSAWKVQGDETIVDITIPEGAEVVIRLPGYEKGVGGGNYRFTVNKGGNTVEK
ncbi:MAG: hypothetical protein E7335_12230, partial [Clostridiales bacterium]|nr:hypothetical protein [Clostridiales bacterium]